MSHLELSPEEWATIPEHLHQRIRSALALEATANDWKSSWVLENQRAQRAESALEVQGWQPIADAPKDDTPVDLWRGTFGERATNMRRVVLSEANIFYEPVESGPSVVRDATHFRLITKPE